MAQSSEKTFDVALHFIVHIPLEDVDRIIKHAEEMGYGYEDPGKGELIRRLIRRWYKFN